MFFRQLFEHESNTYTYLLADEKTKECLLIDPVLETVERDKHIISELGFNLKYILETHVHADHITSSFKLKKDFPTAKSVVHKDGGTECSDIFTNDNDVLELGEYKVKIISTPGHTSGCVSYYVEGMVFTGDALLIRGCGRTDFQQGSPEILYHSVKEKLFTLPENTLVYPAHDYKGISCSSIYEEKNFNPRLGTKTKEEFIEIMNNLKLANPKKIQESVPANLKCGQV